MIGDQVQYDNLKTNLIWLRRYQERIKRPLRVLHIGNIANNAYLNAKILRRTGIEVDVLCACYYHVMACPEWEEVDIKSGYGSNDNHPRFLKKDLKGYMRPHWFVQGPLDLCLKYFKARENRQWRAFLWWRLMFLAAENHFLYKFFHFMQRCFRTVKNRTLGGSPVQYDPTPLIKDFDHYFPDRADRLTPEDIKNYLAQTLPLAQLFEHYDIIQAYSIDPILCLLFSKKPYVAFEHGTLRTFLFDDSLLHRLNSLAYRKANHVFITNGDCLEYARKLGVEHFSPTIHPIDVDQHRKPRKEAKEDIKASYAADVLLFCPLRHDWEIKGTHIHLHALPLVINALIAKRVKLLLVSWGLEVEKSKTLIRDLNCEANVIWLPPLCREKTIGIMHAADVVLDQMALPCFGATAPQALAAGTPVIMSYRPQSTEWILEQPAPIIPAFTAEEVCNGIMQALNEEWLENYKIKARQWVDREHSIERIVNDHLEVYRRLVDSTDISEQRETELSLS